MLDPTVEEYPCAHGMHDAAPEDAAKSPAAHSEQLMEPGLAEYCPAAQAEHVFAPAVGANVPAPHAWHDPFIEYCPAGHAVAWMLTTTLSASSTAPTAEDTREENVGALKDDEISFFCCSASAVITCALKEHVHVYFPWLGPLAVNTKSVNTDSGAPTWAATAVFSAALSVSAGSASFVIWNCTPNVTGAGDGTAAHVDAPAREPGHDMHAPGWPPRPNRPARQSVQDVAAGRTFVPPGLEIAETLPAAQPVHCPTAPPDE